MASFKGKDAVRKALSNAVIEGNAPVTICDQDWIVELLEAGIRIGFKASRDDPRRQRPPKGIDFVPSRFLLTPQVDRDCDELIQRHLDQVTIDARNYGCTQVSDGRSNIRNDPLLVFGVITKGLFYPQGAHNAGARKKDAAYLKQVSMDYLDRDDQLGDYTYASVSDGAAACLNALNLLADEEHILPVRCQSHAVSLFIKSVATKVFQDLMRKASVLIDFIRSRPRVNAILKNTSKGRSVFRFVPTRFETHVIGAGRLLALQAAIQELLSDEGYLSYKADQTTKVQEETMDVSEAIIRDVAFWEELKFFHRVLLPSVRALRLMDTSAVCAKHVIPIWESLEERLIVELMHPDSKNVSMDVKQSILTSYVQEREKAHRPIFDAAWVLDPVNRQTVQLLASSSGSDEERELWKSRRQNTLKVLNTMVKRNMLIKQKQEFRKSKLSESGEVAAKRVRTHDSGTSATFEKDINQLEAARKMEFDRVDDDFFEYIGGENVFETDKAPSDQFWLRINNTLAFYAIRILNVACTISDIERLHKVYAGIHTATRNRLDEDRVDKLSLARIANRIFRLKPKSFISQLDRFQQNSMGDEQALYDWGMLITKAVSATARTIQEPELIGHVRLGDAPIASEPTIKRTVQAEEEESVNSILEDISEAPEEDNVFAGSAVSHETLEENNARPKQKVQLSVTFLASLQSLGLNKNVFERL